MSVQDWLQKLSEASGVSGYEHPVRDVVLEAFRPHADEVSVTKMGSVIALRRGARSPQDRSPAPKVLIEGHMDEIGLMVTAVDKGFIRFTPVGGFDARVLLAQEVIVHGKKDLPGIIGARPPHVLSEEERHKIVPLDELFVDVGLPPEKARDLVHPGDWITLQRSLTPLKNGLVAGKAFDDRAAIVAITEALRQLAAMRHMWDVYAVANVQEEIGSFGAMTSTYALDPDVAIALDASFAAQPDTTEINTVPIDGGMGIALGPNIHPLVHEKLVEVAHANEIPFLVTAYAGNTGTDAYAMQVVRNGVPTGLIDIPLRYMHTSVETLSVNDLERVGRLLAAFCAALDDSFLKELRGESTSVEAPPARFTERKAHRGKKRHAA